MAHGFSFGFVFLFIERERNKIGALQLVFCCGFNREAARVNEDDSYGKAEGSGLGVQNTTTIFDSAEDQGEVKEGKVGYGTLCGSSIRVEGV